ncbi:MAG TPA: Hsp20/alpha crystallin family protein [Candidatus Binatia bacterium]|jgi:HSP20 family protein|nr:Hsp20/alpha crystallin family protein [Candidatus Binatia bacterium]
MEKQEDKEFDPSDMISGALNILGLKIDLGKLLSAPDEVKDHLEQLREKLKQVGGKEVLGSEEWRKGGISISGVVRTQGILGEREYHMGTGMRPGRPPRPPKVSRPPAPPEEVVEPAVDLFTEADEIMVVAEVPGVGLNDLELKVHGGKVLSLSTHPGARRRYQKEIELSAEVEAETLRATCRNGVLEVRLRKK